MPMMNYPRESQSQIITRPVPMMSTSSCYISDDPLLTKDLPMAADSYFDPAVSYHMQADWIRSNSSTSLSPQNSYTGSSSDSQIFEPQTSLHSQTYPQAPSPPSQTQSQPPNFQSAAEKLAYQTARRRAQNRESQRAFRERKNNQIAELESKLSELQRRYEKLQLCFVELSGTLLNPTASNHEYNGTF